MLEGLKKIAQHHGLAEIYVFGSKVHEIVERLAGQKPECNPPASDVDIGVETIPGKVLTAKEKALLTIDLEDLFQFSMVDLIVLSEAPPFLALEIIKGKLLYCRDLDEQAEHELLILRRAGDLAYFEKSKRETIMNRGF
jgi:predicted nucleotidyltransferase